MKISLFYHHPKSSNNISDKPSMYVFLRDAHTYIYIVLNCDNTKIWIYIFGCEMQAACDMVMKVILGDLFIQSTIICQINFKYATYGCDDTCLQLIRSIWSFFVCFFFYIYILVSKTHATQYYFYYETKFYRNMHSMYICRTPNISENGKISCSGWCQ